MHRSRTCLTTALLLTLGASLAHGQALSSLTWVSGVGDDANPCSRTAPGKTFAGAISQTVPGGEIRVLDPGGFGVVTITKSITIDGGKCVGGVLAAGTNGITVRAGSNDVVILRNLDINGNGGQGLSGVRFLAGGRLVLEHCTIYGFGANDGSGVEAALGTGAGQLVLRDVQIRNCLTGVKLTSGGPLAASLEGVSIQGAANGIEVATGTLQVSRSTITLNSAAGVLAEGGTASVQDCLLSGNAVAVKALSGQVRLSNNEVYDNGVGFQGGAGTLISAGNNHLAGNGAGAAPSPTMTLK